MMVTLECECFNFQLVVRITETDTACQWI